MSVSSREYSLMKVRYSGNSLMKVKYNQVVEFNEGHLLKWV